MVRALPPQVHHFGRAAARYARFSQGSPLVMAGLVPGMTAETRCRPALEVAEHLRPDGDHADEQRQRRERGGFLDHGFEHGSLPGTEREHSSWYVLESSSPIYPLTPSTG
jgi:hypothetical protein